MSWNFALILFIALVVTGVIWTIDKFSLRQKRHARMMQAIELARPSWSALPEEEKRSREEQLRSRSWKTALVGRVWITDCP